MISKNVPRLRFEGFGDKWQESELSNIAERITRKNSKLESELPLTISAQYGLVDQETFFNKKVASRDLSKYLLIKRSEFAYNKSYSEGYPYGAIKSLIYYDKGVLSSIYIVFALKKNVDYSFMNSYFDSSCWYREIATKSTEGARNHGLLNVAPKDFMSMLMQLPSDKLEQKHIGNFFSKLDHLIDLHSQKLEQLKKLKRGYLQKMFPQKGETIPRLRFSGFSGIWEEKRMKDIVGYRRGSFPQPYGERKWYDENGYRFAQVVDVKNNMSDDTKLHISSLAAEKSVLAKKGTILVTIQGSIGRVAITKYETYVDRTILLIDKYFTELDSKFLSILLIIIFENKKRLAPGSTIKTITKKELSNFKIKMPDLEEQRRIGQFFEHLDNLIESNNKIISELKRQKKAYLQKMFI